MTGLACGALVVGAVTLLIYPLQNLDPGVSGGVLYVLGVLTVATYWGLWLEPLTSIASAAALNYFHTSPTGEFSAGKEAADLVAIGTLLVTEVVASVIADRARSRVEQAERRVVRDLHDGAQQRLVHTVVTLKLAHRELHEERTATGEALVSEALHHAEQARTELRELVHGMLPSVLTRGGLQAGVAELAARVTVPFRPTSPLVGFLPQSRPPRTSSWRKR